MILSRTKRALYAALFSSSAETFLFCSRWPVSLAAFHQLIKQHRECGVTVKQSANNDRPDLSVTFGGTRWARWASWVRRLGRSEEMRSYIQRHKKHFQVNWLFPLLLPFQTLSLHHQKRRMRDWRHAAVRCVRELCVRLATDWQQTLSASAHDTSAHSGRALPHWKFSTVFKMGLDWQLDLQLKCYGLLQCTARPDWASECTLCAAGPLCDRFCCAQRDGRSPERRCLPHRVA